MVLSLSRAQSLISEYAGENQAGVSRNNRALGSLLADLGCAFAPHEVLAVVESSLNQPVRFVESPRGCSECAFNSGCESGRDHITIPVKIGNVVRGCLIVDSARLTPFDMGLLVLASRVLAACLWELEPTGRTWDTILNCGQVGPGEVQRAFALRGWPSVCTVSVYAARAYSAGRGSRAPAIPLETAEEKPEALHWSDCSELLGGQGHRLTFTRRDLFAVFSCSKQEDPEDTVRVAGQIRQALSKYAGGEVTVGIGGVDDALCRVPALWRRAYDVLRWGEVFVGRGAIVKYEMLGMLGALLDYEPAPAALQEYVKLRLGPLLTHDIREGTDLYHTLTVFVECGGNRMETARRLFVHYNTLRQRLRRIEQLVRVDMSHPVSSLDLSLCVHIASLFPISSCRA